MKKIKYDSKLSFNKEIVSKLNDSQMGGLMGGRKASKRCTHVAGGCGGDDITDAKDCDPKETGPVCTVSILCVDNPTIVLP